MAAHVTELRRLWHSRDRQLFISQNAIVTLFILTGVFGQSLRVGTCRMLCSTMHNVRDEF